VLTITPQAIMVVWFVSTLAGILVGAAWAYEANGRRLW
jgi:hypothetical protein